MYTVEDKTSSDIQVDLQNCILISLSEMPTFCRYIWLYNHNQDKFNPPQYFYSKQQ